MQSFFASFFFLLFTGYSLNGAGLDGYGGWKDIPGKATGWFHIETIHGRDVLITPDGHGFVALGINHLGTIKNRGENEPDLFKNTYRNDWDKFAETVLKQYDDWGFNTVDYSIKPLRDSKPYFAARNFARMSKYYRLPGEKNPYDFPDVFDPEIIEKLEAKVESYCKEHRDNPNLIAYYWTDTPTWDIQKTRVFRGTDWVSEIRKLPPHSPGRRRYAVFLQNRYGHNLARMNRAYDLQVASFGELASIDLSKLDLSRYEIAFDDEAFLGILARTYYGILGPAMRRNDPNHLIFGDKYLLGDIPKQVIEAAVPYIDAIAIQPGDGYIPIYTPGDIYPSREVNELRELTRLPIIICDHQISFATERYPKSIWPYYQRSDEAEAAQATEIFMREAFNQPYLIGYARCQYIDRYSERRNASKLGLVRDDGSPYEKLVNASRRGNQAAKEIVRKSILEAK